MADYKFK